MQNPGSALHMNRVTATEVGVELEAVTVACVIATLEVSVFIKHNLWTPTGVNCKSNTAWELCGEFVAHYDLTEVKIVFYSKRFNVFHQIRPCSQLVIRRVTHTVIVYAARGIILIASAFITDAATVFYSLLQRLTFWSSHARFQKAGFIDPGKLCPLQLQPRMMRWS